MTVRSATIDDAGSIAEVEVDAWRAAYEGIIDQDYLEDLDVGRAARRWRGALLERGSVRVAISGDGVVGFVSFGPAGDAFDADRVGEVYSLYLRPDSWRAGHGSALLRSAVAELRGDGFRSIILWVLPENVAARRFYEVHGWRSDGVEAVGSLGGRSVPHLRYRVLLDKESVDNAEGPVS